VDGELDGSRHRDVGAYSIQTGFARIGRDGRSSLSYGGLLDEVQLAGVALPPGKLGVRSPDQVYYRMETDNGSAVTPGQTASTVDDTASHPFVADGTAVSSPRYSADVPATVLGAGGQPNTASLSFDGSSDYVELGSDPVLKTLPQGDFTIQGWIKTDDGTRSAIFGAEGYSLNFEILGGKLRGYVHGPTATNDIRGDANVIDNQWHHVALVREQTGVAGQERALLYVDGELDAAKSLDVGPYSMAGYARLGRDARASLSYQGLLDEAHIAGVALTPDRFIIRGLSLIHI